jgi:hypothetical protein
MKKHFHPRFSIYFFLSAGIVSGAFILRLMGLGKGIWLDEYLTLKILSSRDFLQALRLHDHPFLYYICLKLWSWINNSDVFLRLFSVFCGTGTVIVLMAWIKQYSRVASLLVGLYGATLPMMLRYSQEIVDYPLFLLAVALSFFYTARIFSSPVNRAGYVGLTFSLTAVVLSHAVGIAVLPAVGIYFLAACPSIKKINRKRIIFSFGVPVCVFLIFVFLFLSGIKKNPGDWWVPPISWQRLVFVSKTLFGLTPFTNFIGGHFFQSTPLGLEGLVIFLFACAIFFFSGDWRRSWPLLAASVFYWVTLVGYSLWVIPVFLERTALPGMIPFMGFVGLHISTIRNKALRIFFIIAMILSSVVFVFFWIQTADKPIERTQETAIMLNAMREKNDIVLFFPNDDIRGLFEHYISLPSDSVLSVKMTDNSNVVEEKLEQIIKRQEYSLHIRPHSVFLVMRLDSFFKRNPEAYVWLLKYMESRFGNHVFYMQLGWFSFIQYNT